MRNQPDQAKILRQCGTLSLDLRAIKDNNLRQHVFFAKNVIEIVLPELAKILVESNLPKDFFLEDFDKLLDNIPTAHCLFTLIYHRDNQFQRPIKINDFNDIWFLTLSIPYCDIVITDKEFASIAKRAKLDRKCNTIILSSIRQMKRYL